MRWNGDGTVTALPDFEDRTGHLTVDDDAQLPDTDPVCQGQDDPGVLAVVDFG